MALRQPNWTRILTILLVILATIALIYITLMVLQRFAQAIVLLIAGALVAYIMTPLVNRLTHAFHFRWLGILLGYAMIAAAFFALGVLLFTPFIQQSQSLVNNLHNPSAASVKKIADVSSEATKVADTLHRERTRLAEGKTFNTRELDSLAPTMEALQRNVQEIKTGRPGTGQTKHSTGNHAATTSSRTPAPPPSIKVPASYAALVIVPATALASDYSTLRQQASAGSVDASLLARTYTKAKKTQQGATRMYHVMSTTPILLLRAQNWLDDHHIHIDLASKFGQAAQQVSTQGTNILNNAITILSGTANILLDFTLTLIISFYLLNDGAAMIRRSIGLVPAGGREQAYFFVNSLDQVLGGYIRGQIFLSILAGILGGGGAAVLGVPYPLLIGIMTGLLELIPVIGPMVTAVPAVIIALFFTPVPTALLLLVWFIVFQQIVTNLVGPRIMGSAVGISPIEAILAVLVGYPIAGLLGAFLAVPVMGIIHILIREAYSYFVLGQALPSTELPVHLEADEEEEQPAPAVARCTGTDHAAGA